MYSWVPFFTELGAKLLDYEDRQTELLEILRYVGVEGGLNDRDKDGRQFPLEEIDPFTFVGLIAKYGDERRMAILARLGAKLGLVAEAPGDVAGMPSANPQSCWFFLYAADREPTAIPLLWRFARGVVSGTIDPDHFEQVLALKYVGEAKLTQGMFWLNPEKYLPVDSQTRPLLEQVGLASSFQDLAEYDAILRSVQEEFPNKRLCEISHEAWLANRPPVKPPTKGESDPVTKLVRYWLYSPGHGARFWEEFFLTGVMAVGWDYLGDLKKYPSKAAIADKIRSHDDDESSKKNNTTTCYSFAHVVRPGDFVFAKQGGSTILGYGQVQSDYQFDDSRDEYKHVRQVQWLKKGSWPVGEDKRFAFKTLTEITSYPDYVAFLKRLIGVGAGSEDGKPEPPRSPAYWWLNANPKIWDFQQTPVGDVEVYTAHTPEGTRRQRYKYFAEVAAGDLIVGYVTSPVREVVALCEVTKPLGPTDEGEGFEFKKVRQFQQTVSWNELQELPALSACEPLRSNQGSLFRLTEDEFEAIRGMLEERNPVVPPKSRPRYSLANALDEVFMPRADFEEALDLLRHKMNIILQGPPGVGKTFLAERLAFALMGEQDEDRIGSVQFHQSFSYEDFIQGIRPNPRGGFSLRDGLFHRYCRRASHDVGRAYVFVIDEINRGNLSKIFGEAMLLIEADKRGKTVQLAYSEDEETFNIPANVHLIGTMNTADRSLAMVDYALRRRFCFVDVRPAFRTAEGTQLFENFLLHAGAPSRIVQEVVGKLRIVNEAIGKDTKSLGPDYELGHSYFIEPKPAAYDKEWLRRIVRYELAPLLREYWFDARDRADEHIEALLA